MSPISVPSQVDGQLPPLPGAGSVPTPAYSPTTRTRPLGRVGHGPVLVAGDVGVVAVRGDDIGVVGPERADRQARAVANGANGSVHARIVDHHERVFAV